MYLTTALAACLALPAMAQDAASPFQTEAAGPSISASNVIGARIYVSEAAVDADAYNGVQEGWNDIGEVNDIILGRDGTVDAVLVDIGGFLGMGERQVAVDMAALKVVQDDATDADDWFLVLQTDRGTLEGAPEYMIPGAAATDADAASTDPAAVAPATEGTTDTAATETATAPADGSMALPEG
ncbi:MAG: PRC-barrel domain-containing protein, partial [Tabrizicola sp.]